MQREGMLSTDGSEELDLVSAAKQQARRTSAARPKAPSRTPNAAGGTPSGKAHDMSADSDSDSKPFDLIAAAKKSSAAAAAKPSAPGSAHSRSPSRAPALAPAPPKPAPTSSAANHRGGGVTLEATTSSDSDEDMLTLAKQRSTCRAAAAVSATQQSVPTLPAPEAGPWGSRSHSRAASAAPAVPAKPLPLPVSPAQEAAPWDGPSHSRTASVASPRKPAVLPAAFDQQQVQAGGSTHSRMASRLAISPAAATFDQQQQEQAGGTHSRKASHLGFSPAAATFDQQQEQAGGMHSRMASVAFSPLPSPTSRAPSLHELASLQLKFLDDQAVGQGPGPPAGFSTVDNAAWAASAHIAPASPASGVPLASLADLGEVVSGVVGELASTLRSDIVRLEAGWQERWAEQASSTAELRQRLQGLQASGASQAQEVSGRLQGMAAEMAMQRSRLEAVEQAQQAQQRAAVTTTPPSHSATTTDGASIHAQLVAGANVNVNPAFEACPSPAADQRAAAAPQAPPVVEHVQQGSAPTVQAILRRLSLLESRVGTQLQQIEAVCADAAGGGSPRSAPVSPLKSGPWGGAAQQQQQQQQHKHTPSRASRSAQAAAVAAAAVYGTSTQGTECSVEEGGDGATWAAAGKGQVGYQQQGTWDYEAALPGSPRIMASGMARPASAAAGYYCSGGSGLPAGGRRSPAKGSGGSASKRSRAVELQVAETHGLIAGIQTQIAAIKNSLAHASGELDARRQEASYTTQRLDQLERTDRHMVKVEASNLSGAVSLERRVRSLEEQVASASRQAAAGGALARETATALRGLEWRVDKSAGATIGTIKALEARQDRARSELHSVAATATLAEAKGATLATEVSRLQRRIHGSGSPLVGCGGGGGRAGPYRIY